ncbi:MAG: MFS transporter [Legionellales bacterium]
MSDSVAVDSRTFVPRGDFMAWVVCLSAGLFFLYEFFQLNLFDVINKPLRDEFNLDATQLSWMSSTYLWANILFLLPAGIILDRFSSRMVILLAMLVCLIGTMGFALTDSFALAAFFHSLTGIGNAFCFLACVVLVTHWFPSNKQALVIGLVVTMAFIGGMLAHTPFAYLNELLGWRRALLVDGLIGAVLLFWIFWIVQDRPEDAPPVSHSSNNNVFICFKKAFSNPQNWLAGLFTSFLNLPIMVLCALWGASYLQVVHHLSEIAATNVVSMILLGSIVGCPVAGWLSDSWGFRKPFMIAGAVATGFTVLPLFLDITLSQTSLSILFFALGFFTSTQVISYPLVAESNAQEHTGAATGFASVLIMGGGGVGQVLFGWLMTYHAGVENAQYTLADFQYAMWMFPIAAVAALIAALLIRETYCKRVLV